jgi:hypothetical protein
MNEPTIIHGPIIQSHTRMVYSITLLSGHVVTSPDGFGTGEAFAPPTNESKPDYLYPPGDFSPKQNPKEDETVVG